MASAGADFAPGALVLPSQEDCVIRICAILLFSLFLTLPTAAQAQSRDIQLPALGDATSGIVSPQQEYDLGRAWLRVFRSRVPTFDDPLMQDYLEELLHELSLNSELDRPDLELVLVANPTMNAFAVPGGVVGVHTGLFVNATSEDQLASVLAHELAHLSQRHFARGVDNQRRSTVATMGGLLAGIILAATAGGDAGMAAITATQAAAMQSSLRYSRQHEQEADRIGMETLYRSGRNPEAAAEMFERMMQSMRYTGHRPPEFLLTHPLTESRIADARNRVSRYPSREYEDNFDYQLMRARARLSVSANPGAAVQYFRGALGGETRSQEAMQYGLVIALLAANRLDEAERELEQLFTHNRHLLYQMASVELKQKRQDFEGALSAASDLIDRYPGYYPLKMVLAETYWQATRYQEAEQVYFRLTRERPGDPFIWYQLAEVRGLAGNIPGVHLARAEYYVLNGIFDRAREHYGYAMRLLRDDQRQTAIIEQKLRDLSDLERTMEQL